jgi:hypothetical protein
VLILRGILHCSCSCWIHVHHFPLVNRSICVPILFR